MAGIFTFGISEMSSLKPACFSHYFPVLVSGVASRNTLCSHVAEEKCYGTMNWKGQGASVIHLSV